jgi:hypothetical protein
VSGLAAYVSGHGFGHAVRTTEVLRTLRSMAPGLPLTIMSAAPEWLFRRELGASFEFRSVTCDVGLVQRGPVIIDEPATAVAWLEFHAGWDARVARETRWLQETGATLVLGDVPPLAFVAARAACVPVVGLANFSWDWIYRHLGAREPALLLAADVCAAAYASADLLLRLPFAGDLSAFPRIEDVGLVARRPRVPRQEARLRLGFDDRPTVLVSFGGLGLPEFDPSALASMRGYRFVLSDSAHSSLPETVVVVDEQRLRACGLEYVDLIGAVDVVISKPGYGIVSDCIAAGTRLIYTERGDFPEYEVLVAEMPRWLACAPIVAPFLHAELELLAPQALAPALEHVLSLPMPARPDVQGATRAARKLLERTKAS